MMRASRIFNFHGLNEPLIYYRVHENNFSKKNINIFYEEFFSWYKDQSEIGDNDFLINREYFKKKLLFLEINHLLLNKKKKFIIIKKNLKISEYITNNKIYYWIYPSKKNYKINKKLK